jgi:6-pyruvoyltetrahydropterin/6-carboxytetrahydropterin synthase
LNELEPFNLIIPTLENITEYFGDQLREVIHRTGGELMQLEGSETPTRSYVIDYSNDSDYIRHVSRQSAESMDSMIDRMLDDMNGEKKTDHR